MRRTVVSAAVVWLSVAGPAMADGWGYPYYPAARPVVVVPVVRYYYYYEPAPIILQQPLCLPAQLVVPLPIMTPPFAQPIPAPASEYKEPPLIKKAVEYKEPPLTKKTVEYKEPPLSKKATEAKEVPSDKKTAEPPKVLESKSFTLGEGEGKAAAATEVTGKGVCQVGFWNITGKEVTLRVDGKNYQVARDHSLKLTLSREFSWQIDGQAIQTERVTADKTSHDVVLR